MIVKKLLPLGLLVMTGCVPNTTVYYRPSMEGGQILARHCVPTKSIIEFGTLPLQVSLVEGNNGWSVIMGLPVKRPPHTSWQTFHFTSSNMQLRNLDNGELITLQQAFVLRDDDSNSIITPYRPLRPGRWLFTVDMKLPTPPPNEFELLVPSMVIDGHEVHFPPIHFERKMWMGISPFNC